MIYYRIIISDNGRSARTTPLRRESSRKKET